MPLVTVHNLTRDTRVGNQIEIANTQKTRLVGLLGRSGLQPEEGLWIRPSSGVHTFGMRFPIDVVGLDKEKRVVKLWEQLVPQRVTALSWSMQSALELAPGTIRRCGVKLGDVLAIETSPRP